MILRLLAILICISVLPMTAKPASAQDCGERENCCAWLNTETGERCTSERASYAGRRIALVIGTDSYEFGFKGELQDLKNARNDALRIGDRLRGLGFSVRYVLNPSAKRVRAELAAAEAYMTSLDLTIDHLKVSEIDEMLGVVYVAGHGFSFADDADRSQFTDYMIFRPERTRTPRDAQQLFRDSRLSTNSFERRFGRLDEFKVLFLFDVCRSLKKLPDELLDNNYRGQSPQVFQRRQLNILFTKNAGQFSTTKLHPASDVSKTPKAGLYAATLDRILATRGLSPLSILNSARLLVASEARGRQVPSTLSNTQPWLFQPISEAPNNCETIKANIFSAFSACNGFDQTCERRVCGPINDADPQVRAGCDLSAVGSFLGANLAESCKKVRLNDDRALAAGLAILELKANPLLRDFDENQVLLSASRTIAAQPGFAFGIGSKRSDRQVELPAAVDLVPDVDNVARRALLAPIAKFKSRVGIPVRPVEGFVLRPVPRESAAPIIKDISQLGSNVSVWLDCDNITCGNSWLGATVYNDEKYTRGFTKAEFLEWSSPDRKYTFDIAAAAPSIGRKGIANIHNLAREAIRVAGYIQVIYEHAGNKAQTSTTRHLREIENIILQTRENGKSLDQARLLVLTLQAGKRSTNRATIQLRK